MQTVKPGKAADECRGQRGRRSVLTKIESDTPNRKDGNSLTELNYSPPYTETKTLIKKMQFLLVALLFTMWQSFYRCPCISRGVLASGLVLISWWLSITPSKKKSLQTSFFPDKQKHIFMLVKLFCIGIFFMKCQTRWNILSLTCDGPLMGNILFIAFALSHGMPLALLLLLWHPTHSTPATAPHQWGNFSTKFSLSCQANFRFKCKNATHLEKIKKKIS